MFTKGSTAMECGGGEKAAAVAEAVVDAVPGWAMGGVACERFEIQKRSPTKYAKPTASTAPIAHSQGFDFHGRRSGLLVVSTAVSPGETGVVAALADDA
jgi:hypothetical protein